ncbi:MAG: aerotolerance regulator BatA [Deltaproteobacteria bacterium HGW-Deltaproteobacteria-13]|jgi:Ca-activated chloride channel family protein|nr:MAG: aerotolerance regulator BatA [Deltaproteobacteria bacterium HGW-Deltaproteobacteria-13]
MSYLEFRNPYVLLLLIPYLAMIILYIYFRIYKREASFELSSSKLIARRTTFRTATYKSLVVLRFLAILMLIIALARPGRGIDYTSVNDYGIDIMVCLDVSGSMRGEDFQPENRLAVAKKVVKDFVNKRPHDKIGMIIFAGEAFLQCPLTTEKNIIADINDEIDFDSVPADGTAIGDAIALAASRMTDSKAASKMILLITDGMNNRGQIDPETAAILCKGMDIKVYTVGIGKEGEVTYPAGPAGPALFGKRKLINHFDERGLRKIADTTGAKFYRAESSGVLWQNITDIDRLERSIVETRVYHEFYDRFGWFLLLATVFFFTEIILRSLIYRKIP